MRFRFGSDDNTAPVNGAWYIDDLEVIDLFNYQGQACITDNTGDLACVNTPEYGVIVEPKSSTGTSEADQSLNGMSVQPNPAYDMLHISVAQALEGQVTATVVAADGRTVLTRTVPGLGQGQILSLDVQRLPAGVYTVRLQSGAGQSAQKVVIR